MAEWDSDLNVFWYGANGAEYIAYKHSYQIFVYPCDNHPNPPSMVIQGDKDIETVEDFEHTLMFGSKYSVVYT